MPSVRVFVCRCAIAFVWAALFLSSQSRANAQQGDNEKTKPGPHIVFMIGEREYKTAETLPVFAEQELVPLGFRCSFVHADAEDRNSFPGLAVLKDADLLVLSVRRRTLPDEQLALVRAHFAAGKPMVGIRTASHAFSIRDDEAPAGHAQWPKFDTEVLGGRYEGHFRNDEGTEVTTVSHADHHPIVANIKNKSFRSGGTLYRNYDLGGRTTEVLRGFTKDGGQPIQMPVGWTNQFGKSRIFYTSLGHEDEFQVPAFTQVLVNAVHWCLKMDSPEPSGVKTSATDVSNRDRYKEDLAGNKQVEETIRNFAGRGEVGDQSEPTPPERAVEIFQVRDGFEMELVAHEPTIRQPLFMSWDERGRMWVVQYLQYPFPAGLKVIKYDQYLRAVFDKVPPPPPNHYEGADKITVLEDKDGDGVYEDAKDVITGLNIATAVTVGHGGIWVLNPPYLLFYPDADGDDVPDSDPEVHLSGFGLEDTHSVTNSLRWGPDGWLYGANGSTTTGTINSDATQNVSFKGQMIWRYHPDTKVFEIYAEGGGNTFSLEIDGKGRVFSGTNNGGTRGMHYAQGGYGKKNWGKHGPLTNPFAFGFFQHMRHEGFQERFSQAFSIYDGGAFPEKYHHAVVAANSLHNRVLASELLADTSTFRTIDEPPLVLTTDRWFRPVDVKVGPDGAVYLADWYDTRLTHVDPRDNWHKSSGRIYRLKAAGADPVAPFDLGEMTNEELIELFAHRNKWFRQEAVRVLGERRDDAIIPRLREIAESQSDDRSLEALWALNLSGGFTYDIAAMLLTHRDEHVRRWTVRLLGDARQVSDQIALQLAELARTEPYPEVRSQLASTAKRLPAEHGLPIVRSLLTRSEDIDDLHIPLLIWWAIEDKTESDREAVLALFDDKSLWDLPLTEQYLVDRLMQRYAMAGGDTNLQTCARLLDMAPSEEHSQRLMAGLLEAFRGRQITDLPTALADALDRHQKSLGETDLALALRRGQPDAIKDALRIITDNSADLPTRLTYIEILGQINQPQVVKPMLGLLSGSTPHSAKRVAMLALMNYDNPEIGQTIVSRYHSSLPAEHGLRTTAHRVLASRKGWALDLLHQIDQWRINANTVALDVVQQMSLHNDDEINALIEKHWGKIRGTSSEEKVAQTNRLRDLLRSGQGSLPSGKALFKQHCATCHTLFGEGGQTGPELTGYERTNLDFMLLATVDPSAAIREEFTSFLIATTDGRTLTGLIDKQDTRTVTLRAANNEATLINRDDIDTLQALSTSLMPEGLMQKLNDQQVRDLFAYLMSRAPSRQLSESGGND